MATLSRSARPKALALLPLVASLIGVACTGDIMTGAGMDNGAGPNGSGNNNPNGNKNTGDPTKPGPQGTVNPNLPDPLTAPAPEPGAALSYTRLLRRVTLQLTGAPPTPAQLDSIL